jgi:hypothetical protein
MKIKNRLCIAFALFLAMTLVTIVVADDSTGKKWKIQEPLDSANATYLFVMHSENGYLKDSELFLGNVGPNTLYFSDRPYRIAGHMETKKFLNTWGYDTEESFDNVPPNVVISFKKGDKFVDMTVEISTPELDGSDVIFNVKRILESDVEIKAGEKVRFQNPGLFIDGYGCWVFGC